MSDLNTPIHYLASGVLFALYRSSERPNTTYSVTIADLHEIASSAIGHGFSIEYTESCVRLLAGRGVIALVEDEFADTLVRTTDDDISSFYNGQTDSNSIYARSWAIGFEWLKTAFDKSSFWERLEEELAAGLSFLNSSELEPTLSIGEIPASDRVVALDHNSSGLQEITQAATDLRRQLMNNNDIGTLSAIEVEAAITEINQIEQQLAAPAVRVSAFWDRAQATLSWIGQEAAGAAVGTAALALLALIASFFGIGL